MLTIIALMDMPVENGIRGKRLFKKRKVFFRGTKKITKWESV